MAVEERGADSKLRQSIAQDPDLDLLAENAARLLGDRVQVRETRQSPWDIRLSRRDALIAGGTAAAALLAGKLLLSSRSTAAETSASPATKPTTAPTPESSPSLASEIVLSRLENEALIGRDERRRRNPTEFDKRIDAEVNNGRVNIVLFGYGAMKWYEAGGAEATQPFRGSQSILSIDTRTGKIDVITPTGQMLAPEIRKYQLKHGQNNAKFDWVDKAYNTGGFDLQRLVIEDMTGLSVDFQVVLQDSAIKSLVDKVFQGLKMDVPADLETMPFVLDGQEYPGGKFSKGEQVLNGLSAVQYIKALAKSFVEGKWILNAEPNPRKHQIFRAMMKDFEGDKYNPAFWFRLKGFLDESIAQKKVACDFDIGDMIKSALSPGGVISILGKIKEGKQPPDHLTIDKTIYMQDPGTGADGGVSWIQATQSTYIKKAVQEGLIADPHDSVPYTENANPFSDDLIDDYWASTRKLVKATSTKDSP